MPNYRRSRRDGGSFFLTLVTHQRRPILTTPSSRKILHESIAAVAESRTFELAGIVLIPDHLHIIMRLPEGDSDYSTRIGMIKTAFTRAYLAGGGSEGQTTESRRRHRVRGVWEKRFWEHTNRDYKDFLFHLEYIHMNPVKHKLVERPIDWPWSSFHRYVKLGWYAPDWCGRIHLPGGTEYYIEPW